MSSRVGPDGVKVQHVIQISRPAYDQRTFDELHDEKQSEDDNNSSNECNLLKIMRKRLENCSPGQVGRDILRFVPVVNHLKEYRLKEWLLSDIVSGISAGVVHIPQVTT
jgi:hypothetical protein